MFRLGGARGYTNLLAEPDDTPLDGHVESLFLGGDKPLHVLPLGTSPAAAAVDVDRVRRLLERLRAIADVVLISAPPPHRVPTGLIWARVADGTLLALDIGRTSREEVSDTLQGLAVADANVIGTTFAQRRPLAEFLGRLRGASSKPPRVEPFVMVAEVGNAAPEAATETEKQAAGVVLASVGPGEVQLDFQQGTAFRHGTIRFRVPETAPPEPPPWSPPSFRLHRRKRRKSRDRATSG
jgi:hypothetical protein